MNFPPQPQWQAITPAAARTLLRRVFQRWGLPRAIQVDNGHPWGLNAGLPPALALWLLGLGVAVRWIPPRQPQRNGTVERGNGVAQQWAEPSACTSRAQLQARLRHEGTIQRERDPALRGRPRLDAYPGLRHSGRAYQPQTERRQWDLARVDGVLSTLILLRRANARGVIWLSGEGRSLGRIHRGKEVCVRFDAQVRQWVVTDLQGQELKRLPARELSRERILALKVGKTHSHGQLSKKRG